MRPPPHPNGKLHAQHPEKHQRNNLHNNPRIHQLIPRIKHFFAPWPGISGIRHGSDGATGALEREAEDVAGDEEPGVPGRSHAGEGGAEGEDEVF